MVVPAVLHPMIAVRVRAQDLPAQKGPATSEVAPPRAKEGLPLAISPAGLRVLAMMGVVALRVPAENATGTSGTGGSKTEATEIEGSKVRKAAGRANACLATATMTWKTGKTLNNRVL